MKLPATVAALALLLPTVAQGQQRDQARLIFNVSAGFLPGSGLWRVDGQPLYDDLGGETVIDSLNIRRRVRGSLTLGVRGIYFRNANVGFFGEAFLLGLGLDDSCGRSHSTSSVRNQQVCQSIDAAETPASGVEVGGGMMYRVASQSIVSPYARASVGLAVTTRSVTSTVGSFADPSTGEAVEVDIYQDRHNSGLFLAGTLGAGFTAQVSPGYQMRFEVRDNMVRLPVIAGPTVQDGLVPPLRHTLHHSLSVEFGFDVVLERRHGRRY